MDHEQFIEAHSYGYVWVEGHPHPQYVGQVFSDKRPTGYDWRDVISAYPLAESIATAKRRAGLEGDDPDTDWRVIETLSDGSKVTVAGYGTKQPTKDQEHG